MADKILSTEELLNILDRYSFRQLHIHHTWKPTHRDFNGKNHLQLQQGMRNFHVNTRGWKDIGHHLALMPDGKWVTGRPFNLTPASIKGWNTGALAVEMVGNFDKPGTGVFNSSGYDQLEGKQKESILKLINYYGRRFGYTGIKFHREGPGVVKTCPGTSLDKARMIAEAKSMIASGGEDDNMTLRRGDKGTEVAKLQQDLINLGYGHLMEPYGADGSFGPATESAVKEFQRNNRLVVDGIADSATLSKIKELITSKETALNYKELYEEAKAKLDEIKKILG
ncbi:MAG TPA: peptidoglycan-binding domain-containing protein [Clostridiales bacterium]|jgi:hypothetical protein|nr:peptidoglycan-binding domain-containing protein [Clostridiales bacterium]